MELETGGARERARGDGADSSERRLRSRRKASARDLRRSLTESRKLRKQSTQAHFAGLSRKRSAATLLPRAQGNATSQDLEQGAQAGASLRESNQTHPTPSVPVRLPKARPRDEPTLDIEPFDDVRDIPLLERKVCDVPQGYKECFDSVGSHKVARDKFRHREEMHLLQHQLERRREAKALVDAREQRKEDKIKWTRGGTRPATNIFEVIENAPSKKLDRLLLKQTSDQRVDKLVRNAWETQQLELQGKLKIWAKPLLLSDVLQDERCRRVTNLRVARNSLESLPSGLSRLVPRLVELDVSQNLLEGLPECLSELRSLDTLRVQYNRLEELPKAVCELPALRHLWASGNTWMHLREEIGRLRSLQTLVVSDNKLVTLPAALASLEALSTLNLNHNCLETLALIPFPDESKLEAKIRERRAKPGTGWLPVDANHSGATTGFFNATTGEFRRNLPDFEAEPFEDARALADACAHLYNEIQLAAQRGATEFDVPSGPGGLLSATSSAVASMLTSRDCVWEQRWDQSSGAAYFVNLETNESQWDAPEQSMPRLDLSQLDPKQRQSRHRAKARWQLEQIGKPEWTYWIDDESGRTEFGNIVTGEILRGRIPESLDVMQRLVNLQVLLLNCNRLTDLPSGLGKLKLLRRLEASHNRIVKVPESLAEATALESINFSENRIEALPNEIGNLKRLHTLRVGGNCLKDVPDSIDGCTSLARLDLVGNKIVVLNARLGNLGSLQLIELLDNPDLVFPDRHTLGKGTPHILWNCRERLNRASKGVPPPATVRPGIGVQGEHLVVEGQFHKTLAQQMDRANATGVLKLHFLGLRALPDRLFHLTKLTELRISGHPALTNLPETLSRLRLLRVLNFAGNGLVALPEALTFWNAFPDLEELDVSDNKIEQVPAGVAVLKQLKFLGLSGNRISQLLDACFRGPMAHSLQHLRVENNRLTAFPAELCSLGELKTLFATFNSIATLPAQFGRLQSLEKLHLSNNLLAELPPSFSDLPNLRVLQLARNKIDSLEGSFCTGPLAASLQALNIQANLLTDLPVQLQNLGALQQMWFDLNPIHSPPQQLHGKTWTVQEVLEYCRERGRRFQMVCKLLAKDKEERDNFDFYPSRLIPWCTDALTDKHKYLHNGDGDQIDAAINTFLNGAFYDHTKSGFEVVGFVTGLFETRRSEKLRRVLDSVLQLLEVADRARLFPPHVFSKEPMIGFGRDNEAVPSYAFKLDAIFEPIHPLDGAESEASQDHESSVSSLPSSLQGSDDEEEGNDESSQSRHTDEEDDDGGSGEEGSSDESNDDDDDHSIAGGKSDLAPGGSRRRRADGTWPSIVQAARTLKPSHRFDFPHSRELVELALRCFEGPYGQVAWVNAPFRFEGEQDLEGIPPTIEYEDRPTSAASTMRDRMSTISGALTRSSSVVGSGKNDGGRLHNIKHRIAKLWRPPTPEQPAPTTRMYTFPPSRDDRNVVILAQLLFTTEEAARRNHEEDVRGRVLVCLEEAAQDWLEGPAGKERIRQVSVDRLGKAADNFKVISTVLGEKQGSLREAHVAMEDVEARIKAFSIGRDFKMHRIKHQRHADKLRAEAKAHLEEVTQECKALGAATQQAKERTKLKIKAMQADTRQSLCDLLQRRGEELCTEVFRLCAAKAEQRRPWDGVHGADFELWKLQRKRAAADRGEDDSQDDFALFGADGTQCDPSQAEDIRAILRESGQRDSPNFGDFQRLYRKRDPYDAFAFDTELDLIDDDDGLPRGLAD
ncbi:Leucine-rich repeat protein lrrA [Durusdinium trenchii]|uniref:Leucine-rich repeat protein lrrA n=1 Tax=Durusdinium trenchii TaxID=1381693 RepID=A0ABP0HWF3_9DINO